MSISVPFRCYVFDFLGGLLFGFAPGKQIGNLSLIGFVYFSNNLSAFLKEKKKNKNLSQFYGIKSWEGRGYGRRLGNLEQMGKCIVNPSEVSFNGGETKDAKPPGVGGGHGKGGREGLLLQFCSFCR